jgi:hypothetical protein
MPETTPELSFDRATAAEETAAATTVQCVACSAALTSYYEVNGQITCERCQDSLAAARRAPHLGPILRATGLGILAAVGGSILYYAVAKLTGYELGLIAIVVGLLVGLAVRRGSRARGGWRYQALAIFLTYLSIASTYVPRVLDALREREHREEPAAPANTAPAPAPQPVAPAPAAAPPQTAADGDPATPTAAPSAAPAAAPAPTPPTPTEPRQSSLGSLLLALGAVLAFTLALPFLAGFDNIMGLIIIGIALYEAWKVNRAAPFQVSGPYRVGDAPPST